MVICRVENSFPVLLFLVYYAAPSIQGICRSLWRRSFLAFAKVKILEIVVRNEVILLKLITYIYFLLPLERSAPVFLTG